MSIGSRVPKSNKVQSIRVEATVADPNDVGRYWKELRALLEAHSVREQLDVMFWVRALGVMEPEHVKALKQESAHG